MTSARRERADVRAVAQHRDAIAQPEDLRQPVRHVEQRHAARLELLDDREQVIGLRVGQRRRRLVEHEDAAVERERARHLQELAVGGRQRLGPCVGIDGQVQLGEQRPACGARISGSRRRPPPAVSSRPAKMFAGDRQVREAEHLLVDHADAALERVARARHRESSRRAR